MKYQVFTAVVPLVLLLCACTTVEPAYKDIGARNAPCIEGGPDSVAQKFYELHLKHPSLGIPDQQLLAGYRPYLSTPLYDELLKARGERTAYPQLKGDLFSSFSVAPVTATVSDASTIPNTDARNIALRVALSRPGASGASWQDEILMAREGTCWTVNDVRYLGPAPHISGGSLRQQFEE